MTETTTNPLTTYKGYVLEKVHDDQERRYKTYWRWQPDAVLIPHKDGKGVTVAFVTPMGKGELVFREPSEKHDTPEAQPPA